MFEGNSVVQSHSFGAVDTAPLAWNIVCVFACDLIISFAVRSRILSFRHGDTPRPMRDMAVVLDTTMAALHFRLDGFHHQRPNPLFNPGGDEERLSHR